ncbi:MAG: hypothetical protein DWH80_04895 [Planctomycetota bacterium]|nr:MAG: hypothetical protein DWH80_04895 [Planctomycetota bacterium]
MAGKSGNNRNRFRVIARTILRLGGELISSDGIAFYELIKNAVDAGAKKIHVEVRMQLPLDAIQRVSTITEQSESLGKNDLKALKAAISSSIFMDAPDKDGLRESIMTPPLNRSTFRERIWWCQNQRRTFNATRKERTGRADHPLCFERLRSIRGDGSRDSLRHVSHAAGADWQRLEENRILPVGERGEVSYGRTTSTTHIEPFRRQG